MKITIASTTCEFQSWWQKEGEWVEAPNVRRGGISGVQTLITDQGLLYVKRQMGHVYRSIVRPWGEPTIMREAHAYECFSKLGISVPHVQYVGARKVSGQWQALLVTQALKGFCDLDQWYSQNPSQAHRCAMLAKLAVLLKNMHQARWQHGCLYAKHIFVKSHGEDVEVALLDLEKCKRRLLRKRASHNDFQQLKRHKGLMSDQDYHYLSAYYHTLSC